MKIITIGYIVLTAVVLIGNILTNKKRNIWGFGDPGIRQKHKRWATEIKMRCKVRKNTPFRGKLQYKKEKPGTDFVSIPGSFMVRENITD